eukprot:m.99839 g.99839  ORF g.99839 m.99839 type:complete len:408 (+) comp13684_c0_seq2:136-1359(+)
MRLYVFILCVCPFCFSLLDSNGNPSDICTGNGPDTCSYGGVCKAGKCVCDQSWTGDLCDKLNLGEAKSQTNNGYNPGNETSFASTWGAGIIQASGEYHMFVNVMSGECPNVIPRAQGPWWGLWGTNSHVVHTVSKDVEGPYSPRRIVLPNVANNPVILRNPLNQNYLLYYEGLPIRQLNITPPVCNGTNTCVENCSGYKFNAINPGPLNVAVASDINGPWVIHDLGIRPRNHTWEDGADLVNPAVYIFKNGTTLFAYRTEQGNDGSWDLAVAKGTSPLGPFQQPTHLAFPQRAEDPVIWRDARGVFQMLVHNCSGPGPPPNGKGVWHCLSQAGSAYSLDGLHWVVRGTQPYSYTVPFSDGSQLQCVRREEPKLLFDDSGQPTHLVTVCAFANFTARVIIQPFSKKFI